MKVYTTDGLVIDCGGYKAVRAGGVVLTKDKKRKHVIGYVPETQLRYILPDDVEPETDEDDETGETERESSEGGDESVNDEADDAVSEDAEDAEDGEVDEDAVIDFTSESVDTTTSDGGGSDTDAETHEESVAAAEVTSDEIGVVSAPSDEGVASHTHDDLVASLGDHDSRISALESRVDELSAQMTNVLEEIEVEPYDPEELTNIRGIGSAYATRLREAGIDTVTKLLETPVEDLVVATEVSDRRAEEWKHRAETHIEREQAVSTYATEDEVDEE
ncbi:helix-hairpin-helix domain-containing protein [Haloferax sp. DFSO60]|uniref:helix-hairpin-helix domain-containing protein n=1 Tax=Haloferax sp. DFSO60 TaxID=3388652 RepID=UPI003978924E